MGATTVPASPPQLQEVPHEGVRAGRRGYDPELSPLAHALLDEHREHNDRVVDMIAEGNRARKEHSDAMVSGMQRLANSQRITAAATTGGLFALLAFVIAGLMLARGIDPNKAAEATKAVMDAVSPTGHSEVEPPPASVPAEPAEPSLPTSDGGGMGSFQRFDEGALSSVTREM